MTDFGKRLKETLDQKGMTQEDLASKACISKSSIFMYIHYGVLPTADYLKQMCIVLNVSADHLLGLEQRQ
jgi:transcriptional regulator with XRE-family HTH domain